MKVRVGVVRGISVELVTLHETDELWLEFEIISLNRAG